MKNIVAIILIIAAVGIYVMYINPMYDNIKLLRVEASKFDEALERSRELLDTRDELLSKYNGFSRDDLERLEKLLPDTVDNVRLIIDIDNIAARYGMAIQNVSIQTRSSEESTDVAEIRNDGGTKASLNLSFSVSTDYQTFLNFLTDLEDSLRILDVNEISFIAPEEEGDDSLYNLTIETYWLK